jgi:hypothetical protein
MVDYINSINPDDPTGQTTGDKLDDQLRALKDKIFNTFSSLTGALVVTHTELNYLFGASSNIQTQIDNLTNSVSTLQGGPYVRSGRVLANGTAEAVPAGWTTTKLATGWYRVTHNLGLTATKYAPSGDPINPSSTFRPALVINVTTNYFELIFTQYCTSPADTDFSFTLGVTP